MSWSDVPQPFSARVLSAFGEHKHKVLATLRADGSPRVSGTELDVHSDGELYLGSMPGARKALDLQRDPRFALHSAPLDVELARVPDVKLSGTVVEVVKAAELAAWASGREMPPGSFNLFRLVVSEAVATWVEGDEMVVESWRAGRGMALVRRT